MPAHRSGLPLSARSAERTQLKFFALAALFFLVIAVVCWMTGGTLWLTLIFFLISAVIGLDYALALKELSDNGVGARVPNGDPMANPEDEALPAGQYHDDED